MRDFVSLFCTRCVSVFGDGGVAVAECRLQSSVNVEVDVTIDSNGRKTVLYSAKKMDAELNSEPAQTMAAR